MFPLSLLVCKLNSGIYPLLNRNMSKKNKTAKTKNLASITCFFFLNCAKNVKTFLILQCSRLMESFLAVFGVNEFSDVPLASGTDDIKTYN